MMSVEVFATYSENSPPLRRFSLSFRSFCSPFLTPENSHEDTLGRSWIRILKYAESLFSLR